jgi:hypothetical protein
LGWSPRQLLACIDPFTPAGLVSVSESPIWRIQL